MRSCDARMPGLHKAMPARVERYDAETRQADVTLLRYHQVDGGQLELVPQPITALVPVATIGLRDCPMSVSSPVRPGDTVLLVFSELELDTWLARGEEAFGTPLPSALAIPGLGLRPFTNAPQSEEKSTTLLAVGRNGSVTISRNGGPAVHVAKERVEERTRNPRLGSSETQPRDSIA